MSLAALLLAAAVSAQPAPSQAQGADHGAQFDSARVSATILRPAVVKAGVLVSGGTSDALHSQRQSGAGYVTYVFE